MNLNLETPFKLYANCVPVKGYVRSCIIDLQREDYYLFPNDLYDILIKFEGKTINSILKNLKNKNKKTLLSYFRFLVSNELIFFSFTPNLFPKIDFSSWKFPSFKYQAVIDVENKIDLINQKIKKRGSAQAILRL